MSTLAERIARGAALLDEKVPGWPDKVDLDKLDLGSCSKCMVGQLTGTDYEKSGGKTYSDGIAELGLEWGTEDDTNHGFDRGYNEDGSYYSYPDLTAAWRAYILERRAKKS